MMVTGLSHLSELVIGVTYKCLLLIKMFGWFPAIPEQFDGSYNKKESHHEAGYDAFITGSCFIALSNFLGRFSFLSCLS